MWKTMAQATLLALTGCAARYGHLPPLAPEALTTPLPYQTLTVDGIKLAYVDSQGSGPPLVLVHGLSSYVGFWEYQLPEFAQTHRVIALDLPGFGASDRPDAPYTPPWYAGVLSRFLEELQLGPAVLVGHSMGGQIALTLALERPDQVRALVLSAPAGIETFTPGARAAISAYWTESRALQATEAEIRANFTTLAFNRPDDGVERLIRERVQLGRHPSFAGTSVAVARAVVGMLEHPVYARLGQIQSPTLLVYGTDDRMIPNPLFTGGTTRAVAEAGRRAIPGAELVLLPGAGHTAHHDDPEGFHRAVRDFLTRVTP